MIPKKHKIKVDILGTEYLICFRDIAEDNMLTQCDGYCDFTSHRIVIKRTNEGTDVEDYEQARRKNLRHELIHAFMGESGLQHNFMHNDYGHDETTVDWFAIQFPKIYEVFKQLNILD